MGDFTYTQATNTVVVINGTSGTPKTFADFVTDDRAGSLTLLSAGVIDADPDTFSLTTQPRPCEKGVIALTISASADRAGATLEIVGKDYDSDAIGETIDIATANATPVTSVLKYNTVDASGITVNGMTNDDTITITQPQWGVIWDYGASNYKIDAVFDIGNASTSTYFKSLYERVNIPAHTMKIRRYSNLYIGEASNENSKGGSFWTVYNLTADGRYFVDGGSLSIYGSIFQFTGSGLRFSDNPYSDILIYNSILYLSGAEPNIRRFATLYIRDVYIYNSTMVRIDGVPNEFKNVHIESPTTYGFFMLLDATLINPNITNKAGVDYDQQGVGKVLLVVNPESPVITPRCQEITGSVKQAHTFNVTVADKDGTLLDGVVVDCEDKNTDAVWAAGTIETGAVTTGKIVEQIIIYKSWTGTSETLATFSPHKFTLSKAGYETLILENVTVDAPIAWHLELQPMRARVLGRPSRRISAPNFQ